MPGQVIQDTEIVLKHGFWQFERNFYHFEQVNLAFNQNYMSSGIPVIASINKLHVGSLNNHHIFLTY
jgi:hypothetical protein